jgi:hypothetical protein
MEPCKKCGMVQSDGARMLGLIMIIALSFSIGFFVGMTMA